MSTHIKCYYYLLNTNCIHMYNNSYYTYEENGNTYNITCQHQHLIIYMLNKNRILICSILIHITYWWGKRHHIIYCLRCIQKNSKPRLHTWAVKQPAERGPSWRERALCCWGHLPYGRVPGPRSLSDRFQGPFPGRALLEPGSVFLCLIRTKKQFRHLHLCTLVTASQGSGMAG